MLITQFEGSSVGGECLFCSLFTGEACEKGMYDKSAPHGMVDLAFFYKQNSN